MQKHPAISLVAAAILLGGIPGCNQPKPAPPAATDAAATSLSSEDLARRTLHRRAVEAVLWGMPAVNFDRMLQSMIHDVNGRFEVLFRLYGPQKSFFEKTWKLPDIQKVQ
jgi:hypothetical protein